MYSIVAVQYITCLKNSVIVMIECNWFSWLTEVNIHPDRFFRWKLEELSQQALSAICEFLHLPVKNTVFVDNATTGTSM